MTAPELTSAVTPVAACLEALNVPYYVTGSLASSAHGIARASLDVDLVADLGPEHSDVLIRCLGFAYIPVDHLRVAVAERRPFNLIHLATMFKVDVFVSPRRPFGRQAAKRARVEALDDGADAPRLPIATAEDTVLAKLEWFRRGGETSERQWWDIVGILKVARGADRARVLRALRQVRKELRSSRRGAQCDSAIVAAIDAVRALDLPHLEIDAERRDDSSLKTSRLGGHARSSGGLGRFVFASALQGRTSCFRAWPDSAR